MDFGSTTVEAKGGEVDAFVAVIDALGEDVYSRRRGGKGAQIMRAAAVDPLGNAVLVGWFDQAFDDGTGEKASVGLDDAFVIKLDARGALSLGPGAFHLARRSPPSPPAVSMVFAVVFSASGMARAGWTLGGTSSVECVGLGLDQSLGMVMAGSFKQAMNTPIGAAVSAGGWDMFLAHQP